MQEFFFRFFSIKEGSFYYYNALGYQLEHIFKNMVNSGIKNLKNIWATFLMRNDVVKIIFLQRKWEK